MKILIACEESQTVTKAFRNKGHDAYSCDVLEQSGGYPEWHIKDDVLNHLGDGWDMMIAHPPCTHLSVSGAKHFRKKREDGRQREAIEFFMKLYNAPIERIAIENPVNIISGKYIQKYFPDLCEKYGLPVKSNQIIQPWQFGQSYQKTTCLWLQNLPLLEPTKIVGKGEFITYKSGKRLPKWYAEKRGKGGERSKFWTGIAQAMANQWNF